MTYSNDDVLISVDAQDCSITLQRGGICTRSVRCFFGVFLLVGLMTGGAQASITYALQFTHLSGPVLDLTGSFTLSHPPAASAYTRYDPVNPQNTLLDMNIWVNGTRSNMVDDVSYSEAPVVLFADGALVYADLNTVAPNLNFFLSINSDTGQPFARFDVDDGTVFASYAVSVVPVPAALPLAATGLAGLAGLGWPEAQSGDQGGRLPLSVITRLPKIRYERVAGGSERPRPSPPHPSYDTRNL